MSEAYQIAIPSCRHCGQKPACILNQATPMLCYACKAQPKIRDDYALPPERVSAILALALDAMVLEAIELRRAGK